METTDQGLEHRAVVLLRATIALFAEPGRFCRGTYALNAAGNPDAGALQGAAQLCAVGGLMKEAGYPTASDTDWYVDTAFGLALLAVAEESVPVEGCEGCARAFSEFREYGHLPDSGPDLYFAENVVAHVSDEHGLESVLPAFERAATKLEGS